MPYKRGLLPRHSPPKDKRQNLINDKKMNDLNRKIDASIELIRKAEKLGNRMHKDGLILAFSGGKDSIVMHRLAEMAGIRFTAKMQITSLDHPEQLKYIRKYYPRTIFELPKINIYELIKKEKTLPLRQIRYCCRYLKEQTNKGKCTLIGVRAEESVNRARRKEFEIQGTKYSKSFDEFEIDEEKKHICMKGGEKIIISPIFRWTEKDVWRFIKENNIEYCKLYDEGYKRIGCIFCPMSPKEQKQLDRKKYPKIEKTIKKSIQYLIDNYKYGNKYNANADEMFNWWVSNKNYDEYFNTLRYQGKINF